MQHTMIDTLRSLGMYGVRLNNGVVELDSSHVVCKAKKVLTADQCKLLKLFEYRLSQFQLSVVGAWNKDTGVYTAYTEGKATK